MASVSSSAYKINFCLYSLYGEGQIGIYKEHKGKTYCLEAISAFQIIVLKSFVKAVKHHSCPLSPASLEEHEGLSNCPSLLVPLLIQLLS